MSDIHLSGFLFSASGAAVEGATVEAFAKNTVTETGGCAVTNGSTTTNSSGYYTMTVTADNEHDVRITSGNSVRWRKFDDRLQIEEVEVSTLNIREGATAQVYTIAPGSISADRTLTLPAATGNDTLASLGLAQTFSAAQTFTGAVTVGSDGSGTDVIFYSGTAGDNLTWDASEELLTITGTNGATALNVADGNVTIADNLTVSGNLTVTGTTTSVDSTTINAATAFVFEGATADAHETTLGIVDPTADATINLPAMSAGTYHLPVMSAASTTAVSSTPAELNLLDGSSANTVVNSKAVIYGSGGEVAGTLSTAAQTAITSLGTLTALTVDDVAVNGKVITMTGDTGDTIVFTAAANGAFSLVTTDAAGAAGNIQITADGTVDIDSAGVLTLDSGAAINIEPASGSAILLDGTISIDAGVVTGATSITSTAFVGAIDGAVGGNTPAAITGTTIDATTDFTIGTTVITDDVVTFTPTSSDTVVLTAAANGAFSIVTTDDNAAAANIQITADGTVDIDSEGVLTLDSGAAINIEPAAGSAVLIDGNVSIDGDAVTGIATLTASGVITAGGFTIGSAAILEAELEILDGASVTTAELNIIDGGTSATSTTIADADRVVLNDNGTMVQVAVTDLKTYIGGGPDQADQTAIEARTNQDTYIAPDMLHFHAGVAKTWVYFPATGVTGTLTNNNSYNITELTDTNVGVRTIEIATAFSNSTYAPMGSGDLGPSRGVSVTIVDANTVLLQSYNTSSTLTDYAGAFSAHGDQ